MNITASMVNDLRNKTGAGMMDCKKALMESGGDEEKAIDILRKKGAAVALKRADKTANEGIVIAKVSADSTAAVMVEVNCETDFVAKSEDFKKFAEYVVEKAFAVKAASPEDLMAKVPELEGELSAVAGKVGERTIISRLKYVENTTGCVIDYIHYGSRLGVLISYDNVAAGKVVAFTTLGRNIAIQVAAMTPSVVYREEVDPKVIAHEMEIYKDMARQEKKPENLLEKIAQGRLNKYFQEVCLYEQSYFSENSKQIKDLLDEFNKAEGTAVKINSFVRYNLSDPKE
ncbi:MAG: translation elongation factor Ts [Ignavibacteriaceae bacterium]|nr:translation elongation factor Ts [Ignavibacteriaceae bacterium]